MPKVEDGVITPPTRTPYDIDLDEDPRQRCKPRTELQNKNNHHTRSTLPEGDKHGKRNSSLQKVPVLEEQGIKPPETEDVSDYKSKDSSNVFGN